MGLGNPGPDYQDTRHNAGFWFVDHWAGTLGLSFRKAWFRPFLWADTSVDGDRLVLVKPLTYMNLSGAVLPHLFRQFGATASDLLVVFDQMDLPPGRLRLKPHGSAAGHNGLKSVEGVVGEVYHRLAVGVGRPGPGVSVIDHVLGTPSEDDRSAANSAVHRGVLAANDVWNRGWEPLINGINRRDPA